MYYCVEKNNHDGLPAGRIKRHLNNESDEELNQYEARWAKEEGPARMMKANERSASPFSKRAGHHSQPPEQPRFACRESFHGPTLATQTDLTGIDHGLKNALGQAIHAVAGGNEETEDLCPCNLDSSQHPGASEVHDYAKCYRY